MKLLRNILQVIYTVQRACSSKPIYVQTANCTLFDPNTKITSIYDYFNNFHYLNEGGFGRISTCTSKSNPSSKYTVKENLEAETSNEILSNEASILIKLKGNPYFPRTFGYIDILDQKGKQRRMLFNEYVKGTDLYKLISNVSAKFFLIGRINIQMKILY